MKLYLIIFTLLPLSFIASASEVKLDFELSKKESINDYWQDWAFELEQEPLYSSNVNNSYFGLGWWSPEIFIEDTPTKPIDTYIDWVKNQGVSLSYAYGKSDTNYPRFRFDYRWHEELKDNFFITLEVPIQ